MTQLPAVQCMWGAGGQQGEGSKEDLNSKFVVEQVGTVTSVLSIAQS